jgi:hypothetical protein
LGTVIGTDSQGASSATGTSMAAPQVAALAAYVWALDPTLTGPEVVDLLIRTSRDDYNATATGNASPAWGCNATAPAPVIDAFDAVLAAGGVSAQTALADVTDAGGSGGADGVFDEHDIEAFLGAWTSAPTLDYSRFDLNGDGLAEGAVASAFPERVDLDGDGTVGTATVDWLGVSVTVDETAVTDLQILCHLAYGPAYAGDAFARNRLLGQPCGLIDVDIVNPDDGDAFPEGETIAFLIDASIASPHDGDIVLRSGGAERDRYRGYSHLDDFTITTLSTREVCPSDPVVEVAFEDAVTGLRATDRVTLDITANGLSVSIAGGDPRWVRAKRDTATGELFHEPISLAGKASVPSCTDPFSERIDQSTLEWRGGGTVLGNGPTLGLPGDYLRAVGIPGKEFFARSVELIYAFEGATDSDRVRLEPCTSSLGLGPTEATVEDVPECPLQGVIGSLVEQLRDTFGSVDPADTEEIVGRIIHGVPDYRAVLEELGSEPCDPRFCDPFPPDFPRSQGELSGSFYGDRGLATSGFLDRLFEALAQPGVEAFDAELDGLLRDVAASSELSDADRELIAASAGVALGVVDVVARLELDGRDPWRAFGFAGDPEALAGRVDTLEPAAKGVQGFLTAVVVERVNSGFDAELHLDAAAYAASLAAFQEARKAARE